MSVLLVVTFLAGLCFNFVNGFHDAANAIATVVTTRVLSPRFAVAWAAFFNLSAAFTFGVAVADTVATGVVDADVVTIPVILAGLVGAVSWNVIAWWFGLPSSSSHALIGGYAGAATAFGGSQVLIPAGLLKIAAFILISPLIGMALGLLNMVVVTWIVHRFDRARMARLFRRLQLVSAAIYSFAHGTNDAQVTMGILFALLVAGGHCLATDPIPTWVVLLSYTFISLGTLGGGMRIVHTTGTKLTRLEPVHGFCAETGGGVTILAVSALGIPVSTTHTITGAIVGVGAARNVRSVRGIVARRILWAWVLTIPMSGLIAAGAYLLLDRFV